MVSIDFDAAKKRTVKLNGLSMSLELCNKRFLFARAKSLRRNTLWQKKRIKATALRFPTGLR